MLWELLEKWKQGLKEQWSNKVFQRENTQHTAEANAGALAQFELLNKLTELDIEEINEAFSDDE